MVTSSGTLKPAAQKQHVARAGGLLAFVGTILAIAQALFPGISITPGITQDKSDAFAQRFVISNGGWLPLSDIEFEWRPNKVIVTDAISNQQRMTIQGIKFDNEPQSIGKMPARAQTTVQCDLAVIMRNGQIRHFDVSMRIKGNLLGFLPVRPHIEHFTALRDRDGAMLWTPRSETVDLTSRPINDPSATISLHHTQMDW